MNKYFYPIYKMKLKPWIKYWLLKKTSKRLPEEFQEVEWIESSGTQRIDSGILRDVINTYRYQGSFNYSNVTNRQLHGAQGGFYIGVVSGFYQVEKGGNQHTNIQAVPNEFIDFDVYFDTNNRVAEYTINSIYETHNSAFSNTPSYAHIFLFSLNDSVLPSSCKMKYFKIYQNDSLIRDFVPCYRKSDDEIGMYDLVEKKFYTNAGTGSFTKGSDI